jgi:flagellar assembly factor FliW
MIKLKTSRFGELEVEEDRVVDFPEGLIGLPETKTFILIDHKDTPLKWLQAVDDPDIAFIVVSPEEISEGYNVDIDKKVQNYLQLDNDDDLAILVTMRVDGDDVIANFQGPLLINACARKGVQVVLENAEKTFEKIG